MSFFKKIMSGLSGSSEDTPEDRTERLEEYEQIFQLAKKKELSPEKKAELEALYVQLIKKSDNVTSGQLQFLGLAEIKQKMGATKWQRLQSEVYATADEVIRSYISISDIHFLFKEDRYVIIFTQSSDEEINRKVTVISNEIMRRLALLDSEELKTLQVKQEIKKVDDVETFLDNDFPDMLEYVFRQYNPTPGTGASMEKPLPHILEAEELELSYRYVPMWELDKKSLTTYLCLAQQSASNDKSLFNAYKNLFRGKSLAEKTIFDIRVLERTIEELEQMEMDDRKGLLICPVQHETIYNFNSYDEYKSVCQTIPNGQRESLIFLVTNSETHSLPAKDTYWFIPLMKDYCGGVFIDLPMRESIHFPFLKNSGASGIGVQLQPVINDEEKNIKILFDFNYKAKELKMKKTFVFNVNTSTAAKTLGKMGFNYLSGDAILAPSTQPKWSVDPENLANLTSLAK